MKRDVSGDEYDARVERIARGWAGMAPPIRLSAKTLARYDAALRALELAPGAEALLLGSTPELRALAATHRLTLTGADIDPVFWAAMGRLGGRAEDGFIGGDWLDLPADRTWDVVLGDGSLNMLPWPRMRTMMARLGRMVPPGGPILLRLQAIDPALDLAALRTAFAAWTGPRNDRAFLIAHHFLVESLRNAMHPEMTNRAFYEAVVGPLLDPDDLARLRPFLRDRRNCYPPLDDLMAALEAHFVVIDRQPCLEPGAAGTTFFFALRTP